MESKLQHADITEKIIGAAFEVYGVLGYGFLESVYQKAMQVELQRLGFKCEIECPIKVKYKDAIVGDFRADLFVNEVVIVELKTAKNYNSEDEPQLLNELKATGIKVGLLINFGRTKVEFIRRAF
jgi:GxxExxY protein